jgi:hypothetical protein
MSIVLSTKSSDKVEASNLSPAAAIFVGMMQEKLDKKYEQFGDKYVDVSHVDLLLMLDEHVRKGYEVYEFKQRDLAEDMTDIANIAMMIALNEIRRNR